MELGDIEYHVANGNMTAMQTFTTMNELLGSKCEHELVSIKNKVITSGYMCMKCRELFKSHCA